MDWIARTRDNRIWNNIKNGTLLFISLTLFGNAITLSIYSCKTKENNNNTLLILLGFSLLSLNSIKN
jgi:hypothetical protein